AAEDVRNSLGGRPYRFEFYPTRLDVAPRLYLPVGRLIRVEGVQLAMSTCIIGPVERDARGVLALRPVHEVCFGPPARLAAGVEEPHLYRRYIRLRDVGS